jgi:hypothetical protein
MLIDIYMDGFSLHWRSAPLRRTVNPRRRQALDVFQPSDSIAHRVGRHVFFMPVFNVFAVGRLESFVPILPTCV